MTLDVTNVTGFVIGLVVPPILVTMWLLRIYPFTTNEKMLIVAGSLIFWMMIAFLLLGLWIALSAV